MKRVALAVFLILICSLSAVADEAADVIATLHAACKAYQDANVEQMEALLTEDFTLTDDKGVVTTRADDVKIAKDGSIKYRVFANRDMKARVYGDAAVVTGITDVAGMAGETAFSVSFQFTDTLVRRDGKWRVAASHVSRLR
jgi:hypothetical protein